MYSLEIVFDYIAGVFVNTCCCCCHHQPSPTILHHHHHRHQQQPPGHCKTDPYTINNVLRSISLPRAFHLFPPKQINTLEMLDHADSPPLPPSPLRPPSVETRPWNAQAKAHEITQIGAAEAAAILAKGDAEAKVLRARIKLVGNRVPFAII